MLKFKWTLLLIFVVVVGRCESQQSSEDQSEYYKVLLKSHRAYSQAQARSNYLDEFVPPSYKYLSDRQEEVAALAEAALGSELAELGPYDVSPLCLNHTKLLIEAIGRRETWALRMIDAMGKPGSALLDFHLMWVGNWEECLGVQATQYQDPVNKTGPSHPYTGKYCIGSVPLNPAAQSPMPAPGAAIMVGMCYPDSCSSADATALAKTLVSLIPMNISLPIAVNCREKKLEYSTKAIAIIVVCSFFAALIVLATLYDILIQHFLASKPEVQNDDKIYGSFNRFQRNGHVAEDHEDVVTETTPLNPSSGNWEAKSADDEKVSENRYKPGIPGNLLLSFSIYSNAQKIFNTKQPAGTLTCVNGIRFISMTWVMLGHTYAFGLMLGDNLATFYPEMTKRFTFQAIANATVSVDTFFVLSGLLVAYLSLREMDKRGGARKFKWGMFYFHRFWRLTPPYMLLLMMYVPTFKYWSDGPFWPQKGTDVDECKDTWWTNLLYINNLYKMDKMCMGWSWYLANDMQFYVLSPIMLIPLYYSPLWGTISCLMLILVNFISAGVISKQNKLDANILFDVNVGDAMSEIYIKPWARIGPYVVGFFTGYLLYKTQCKVKMSKLVNVIGWLVATVVALLVLYGLYTPDGTSNMGVDTSALYNATSRTAWGMCVAWVIFSCASGYGGPVNALLSWRPMIPFSRLTYCAYLVHPLVMYVYYYSRRTLIRWYDLEVIYLFLGSVTLSYAAAFVISLAFESPMMGLEKVLLGRKKNS